MMKTNKNSDAWCVLQDNRKLGDKRIKENKKNRKNNDNNNNNNNNNVKRKKKEREQENKNDSSLCVIRKRKKISTSTSGYGVLKGVEGKYDDFTPLSLRTTPASYRPICPVCGRTTGKRFRYRCGHYLPCTSCLRFLCSQLKPAFLATKPRHVCPYPGCNHLCSDVVDTTLAYIDPKSEKYSLLQTWRQYCREGHITYLKDVFCQKALAQIYPIPEAEMKSLVQSWSFFTPHSLESHGSPNRLQSMPSSIESPLRRISDLHTRFNEYEHLVSALMDTIVLFTGLSLSSEGYECHRLFSDVLLHSASGATCIEHPELPFVSLSIVSKSDVSHISDVNSEPDSDLTQTPFSPVSVDSHFFTDSDEENDNDFGEEEEAKGIKKNKSKHEVHSAPVPVPVPAHAPAPALAPVTAHYFSGEEMVSVPLNTIPYSFTSMFPKRTGFGLSVKGTPVYLLFPFMEISVNSVVRGILRVFGEILISVEKDPKSELKLSMEECFIIVYKMRKAEC